MTLFDTHPQYRFYPLSPLYNFRFSSFGFLSQTSDVPIATSLAPNIPSASSSLTRFYSPQGVYLLMISILQDTLERLSQAMTSTTPRPPRVGHKI